MQKSFLLFVFLTLLPTNVLATWSIIIIDPKTKEIGIAGASCTYSCYGIGKIVPNVGAIIVQAMSNNDARNKGVQMILAETSPADIIQALRDPVFDPERQQYAVVTIKYFEAPATYNGTSTHDEKGALTVPGVAVQGNTLVSKTQIEEILHAVKEGQENSMHIADILMTALEAGSDTGGDNRCGAQKAQSAFITVARPSDKKPYIDLLIFGQGKGKQNAVKLLRIKYDKWKRKHSKKQ